MPNSGYYPEYDRSQTPPGLKCMYQSSNPHTHAKEAAFQHFFDVQVATTELDKMKREFKNFYKFVTTHQKRINRSLGWFPKVVAWWETALKHVGYILLIFEQDLVVASRFTELPKRVAEKLDGAKRIQWVQRNIALSPVDEDKMYFQGVGDMRHMVARVTQEYYPWLLSMMKVAHGLVNLEPFVVSGVQVTLEEIQTRKNSRKWTEWVQDVFANLSGFIWNLLRHISSKFTWTNLSHGIATAGISVAAMYAMQGFWAASPLLLAGSPVAFALKFTKESVCPLLTTSTFGLAGLAFVVRQMYMKWKANQFDTSGAADAATSVVSAVRSLGLMTINPATSVGTLTMMHAGKSLAKFGSSLLHEAYQGLPSRDELKKIMKEEDIDTMIQAGWGFALPLTLSGLICLANVLRWICENGIGFLEDANFFGSVVGQFVSGGWSLLKGAKDFGLGMFSLVAQDQSSKMSDIGQALSGLGGWLRGAPEAIPIITKENVVLEGALKLFRSLTGVMLHAVQGGQNSLESLIGTLTTWLNKNNQEIGYLIAVLCILGFFVYLYQVGSAPYSPEGLEIMSQLYNNQALIPIQDSFAVLFGTFRDRVSPELIKQRTEYLKKANAFISEAELQAYFAFPNKPKSEK